MSDKTEYKKHPNMTMWGAEITRLCGKPGRVYVEVEENVDVMDEKHCSMCSRTGIRAHVKVSADWNLHHHKYCVECCKVLAKAAGYASKLEKGSGDA